jgi:CRP/FNR family cyclic AMP-dependent transcriptional regulator
MTEIEFLKSVPVFRDLEAEALTELNARLREKRLSAGEVLFRDGDTGQEMYIIREGNLSVMKPVSGQLDQILATLTTGNFFGEMSIFDRAPRSATICADTDVVLLCLDKKDCDELLEEDPATAAAFFYRIIQTFIDRLRHADNLLVEVTRWGLEQRAQLGAQIISSAQTTPANPAQLSS